MGATLTISRIVDALPPGHVLTTRAVIGAGSRDAVDQCLGRLVKAGVLSRLARGVFVKGDETATKNFTPLQIAKAKAAAFHKEIFEHPSTTAQRLNFIKKEKGAPTIVATNGSSSSSFVSCAGTIQLKAVCARKRHDDRNEIWEVLKACWHIGARNLSDRIISHLLRLWGRKSQQQLQEYCSFIPHWLLDIFPHDSKLAAASLYAKNVPPDNNQNSPAKDQTPAESPPPEANDAPTNPCTCTNKENCICPDFTCDDCQNGPIRNRFRLF